MSADNKILWIKKEAYRDGIKKKEGRDTWSMVNERFEHA